MVKRARHGWPRVVCAVARCRSWKRQGEVPPTRQAGWRCPTHERERQLAHEAGMHERWPGSGEHCPLCAGEE